MQPVMMKKTSRISRTFGFAVVGVLACSWLGCTQNLTCPNGVETCSVASDCPVSTTTSCVGAVCTAGCCYTAPADAGTSCTEGVCDGTGKCVECLADGDCPAGDTECIQNNCDTTTHACSPSNAPEGTTCSDNAGLKCNGDGVCVECLAATDCTGSTTECSAYACDPVAQICVEVNADAGTPCDVDGGTFCDVFGDCIQCLKDSDCQPTTTACAKNTCGLGTKACTIVDADAGTKCDDNGGTVCDGDGGCVECLTAADCPTPATCVVATCDPTTQACGTAFAGVGTPCGTSDGGTVCDGKGNCACLDGGC
jgi:hypothetical protein